MNETSKNLSFKSMFCSFGIYRLIFCAEFYISVILALLLSHLFLYLDEQNIKLMILELAKTLVGIDAAIFAIVITGLAILSSVTSSQFLDLLISGGLYAKFFFPFYMAGFLWVLHMVLSLVLFLFSYGSANDIVIKSFLFIYIWLFFYCLFNSLRLVGTIIRLTQRKVEFDKNTEQN